MQIEGSEISCQVNVSGVGQSENGDSESIDLKLRAEEDISLMKNQKLDIISVCYEKPTIIGTAQNAEICVDVEICYSIKEFSEVSAVCCLEISEEHSIKSENRPSLVVLCSERNSDIWSLAKKYGSTMEMIENVNKTGEEFSVSRRPLLIPRAK